VPPTLYGGTERVVSYLTEALVQAGHDVTLFATGDSITTARLVSPAPRALRLDPRCVDQMAHHVVLLEHVFREASEFDLVHFHLDYLHFSLSRRARLAQVTTLHGRLDIPDLAPLYAEFPEMPVVSISNAQRMPLPDLNWVGTVYHGLPDDLYPFHPGPGKYLAFVGRISPEKRVDRAIRIALRTGMPLLIAAKVDKVDREYFDTVIAPLLRSELIEYIGEVGDIEKGALLGGASALLFPIAWPEPFGLVMIEAMACGTPTIAYRCGSVPEVMQHGRTGFIVDTFDEALVATEHLDAVSRADCRAAFEERFTAGRMAQDYLAVYDSVLDAHAGGSRMEVRSA
jgi:glycosyltransferase involved in cell wall biosynthesis